MSNQNKEELEKSIDMLIDELFSDNVEKSLDLAQDSKTTADAAINQAPSLQNDESRGAGRPKAIHDMPQKDQDGQASKEYDGSISEEKKEEDQPEINQVSDMSQIEEKGRIKPSSKSPDMAPFKKSISEEEYAEFLAFKKSKEEAKAEELKKAETQKTEDLIKAVVEKTAARYESQISTLQKSLAQQESLLKSLSKQPQPSKSITNVEALEKSLHEGTESQRTTFSKSELLDAAEELVKSGQLRDDHVIELENNGYIYDPRARKTLESYLAKR